MLVAATMIALTLLHIPLAYAESTADRGSVVIHVLFRGAVSLPTIMHIDRDTETCGLTAALQPLVVNPSSGGLKNAVVAIEGLQAQETEPPLMTPVALSNVECHFVPQVFSLQTGTALEIHNRDPIMHNTHIKIDARTLINIAMVANVRPIAKKVPKAGLYRIQCDAHKFMQGYAMAFDHPYFAVSDEDGLARIRHVPAGTHEISVWHETLGQLRSTVTVPANGEAAVTFQFPVDVTPPARHGGK